MEFQFTVPADVAAALGKILSWALSLWGPKAGDPTPQADSCCQALCADVPAGKKYLVICDGGVLKAVPGTQDGQYWAWDQTAGTWVLTTI